MLFNLFMNPNFKAYIEIMAIYQRVKPSLCLCSGSAWFIEAALHYAVHTPWPEEKCQRCIEAECSVWKWLKKGSLLFRHHIKKRKILYPRGWWTENIIFFFYPTSPGGTQETQRPEQQTRIRSSSDAWSIQFVRLHSQTLVITHTLSYMLEGPVSLQKKYALNHFKACSPVRFLYINICVWS